MGLPQANPMVFLPRGLGTGNQLLSEREWISFHPKHEEPPNTPKKFEKIPCVYGCVISYLRSRPHTKKIPLTLSLWPQRPARGVIRDDDLAVFAAAPPSKLPVFRTVTPRCGRPLGVVPLETIFTLSVALCFAVFAERPGLESWIRRKAQSLFSDIWNDRKSFENKYTLKRMKTDRCALYRCHHFPNKCGFLFRSRFVCLAP